MLKVSHVTKKYRNQLANDDISFEVGQGQIAILAGPNGAGKSTIIKSIAGLLRYEGEITIGGFKNKSSEAKQILGYIPELPNLYEMMTVWEHLEFIARAYKLDNWKEEAQALLARFDLTDAKDKLTTEMSKGMKQKTAICCALLPKPKMVLFDEPMIGLDPHGIKQVKEIFGELKSRGAAVLISTHILDSVEEYWDSVHILKNGKILANRTRDEIAQKGENLEELFFAVTEGEAE